MHRERLVQSDHTTPTRPCHEQDEHRSPEVLDAVLGGRPLVCLGECAEVLAGWRITQLAGLNY